MREEGGLKEKKIRKTDEKEERRGKRGGTRDGEKY